MLGHLKDLVLHFLAVYELPTLFVLVFLEEMGAPLPLPSDTLIAYAGAIHGHAVLNALMVIGTVSLAATLGSSVLYLVCHKGGPAVVGRLTKLLHLHPDRIERLEGWFKQRGAVAIIVARLTPGLRIPATVMAGLANVPYHVFVPGTAVAAVIWSTFYYFVGDALRGLWMPVIGLVYAEPGRLWGLLLIVVVLLALWFSLPMRWRPLTLLRRRRGAAHLPVPEEVTPDR